MIRSISYAYFAARLGLAVSLGWLSVQIFRDPVRWLDTGLFSMLNGKNAVSLGDEQIMYLLAVIFAISALSFLTTVFSRIFAVFLILISVLALPFSGASDFLFLISFIGLLCVILLWPLRFGAAA